MTVEPAVQEVSFEDIAHELVRRRRIYTELFRLTPPNVRGERTIDCESICGIFDQPMKNLASELGFTVREMEVSGWGRICVIDVPMGEGVSTGVEGYRGNLYEKMSASGWLTYEVLSLQESGRWLYRVRLLVNPDELDGLPEAESATLPIKLIPIGTIELERAFRRLMAASLEFRGERIVVNPEDVLKSFGEHYDTHHTVDLLIDAGLAEWRTGEAPGVTAERLFLHPPTFQDTSSIVEIVSDPMSILRRKRGEFVEVLRLRTDAERATRVEADLIRAQLRELDARTEVLAEEGRVAAREIEKIDAIIREFDEIAQMEWELAQRKARALERLTT